jgi:sugar-specific transcriptional regulator TrmB
VQIEDSSDLVSELQSLGFTEYEARAYFALTQSCPATAYEVAKVAGMPRANVYDVLRSLEIKGAIQCITENPTRYIPCDAEEYFDRLRKNTAEICTSVTSKLKHLSRPDDDVYVWVVRGETEVRKKLIELITGAQEHIWIKGPMHLIEPYLSDLTSAAQRGVDVKLVVFGTDIGGLRTHPRITVFPHEGGGDSFGASDVLMVVNTDSNGVMIVSYVGTVISSYARNHSIVYTIQTLLLHEMFLAEIYKVMGAELDTRFGKRLAKLRKKHRPPEMDKSVFEQR